jgi:hypothetical protein
LTFAADLFVPLLVLLPELHHLVPPHLDRH